MAFRFMKPKTRIVPIKKSEEDQEVLDKLQEYLDSALEEPVRFLVRFWKDQAAVLTYKELRKIAVNEEFPEEIMKDWRQDYSRLLRDKMTPVWEEAVKAGIQSNPVLQGMRFDTRELVGDWITEHTAEMVTRVTDDQVKAIRYIVGESVTYKMGADETARYIRPIVGLTEQQTAANIKYYNNIKEQMAADHPRMKTGSIEQKARDAAAKYASKQHRTRADTIARTEIITAYHEGNDRGVRECIYDGRLPKMKKVWSTSLDAKVCSACQALEGVELDMDGEFSAKSGRRIVTTSIPPLHPRCACAVKYVESRDFSGIIEADRIIIGHERAPKQADSNAIIDHIGKDGKVDIRTFYDSSGIKHREIHTNNHGNSKQHPYGENGEHVHIYVWDSMGRLKTKAVRNLADIERKENSNIL